jgi:ribonuclease HI
MATKWMKGWKSRGWKKKGGAIKNLDLVKRLDALQSQHKVTWTHIRGHSGEEGNEYVDALCNAAMDAIQAGISPAREERFAESPVRVG